MAERCAIGPRQIGMERRGSSGAMVNWYRATGIRVPKPKDLPQQMPEVHCDAIRISMPHLVLWGKHDLALPPQSYMGLKMLCYAVTIIEVTNVNYWLHYQVSEEL